MNRLRHRDRPRPRPELRLRHRDRHHRRQHLKPNRLHFSRRRTDKSQDHFGADEAASFWKRGSFLSGSNIGSSRSSAGVSGTPSPSPPEYGIESSFCKAAMARSGSPILEATRARTSMGTGPVTASFSIGFAATARSAKAMAAALSP